MSRATVPQPKKDRKTGSWYFVFDSQYPKPDGSRRQIFRRGFSTRKAAKDELKRLMDEDRPPGDLTVGHVLDRFVHSKERAGRAPNTVDPVPVGRRAPQGTVGWLARREADRRSA